MELKERIAQVIELLGITHLSNWDVYFPPPVDDWDPTRRASWDMMTNDKYVTGARLAWHKYDEGNIAKDGVPTVSAEKAVSRGFMLNALVSELRTRTFINTAGAMWQPDKGFFRCYLEYRCARRKRRVFWWLVAHSKLFRERFWDD